MGTRQTGSKLIQTDPDRPDADRQDPGRKDSDRQHSDSPRYLAYSRSISHENQEKTIREAV